MGLLILGLVIFLGAHSISIVGEGWRNSLVSKLGDAPYKIVYSVASLIGLILIVRGYGEAP